MATPTHGVTRGQARFVNRVAELMTEDDCLSILQVCRDAMKATQNVRAGGGDGGRIRYEEMPDHQIRLAGASMLASLTLQKPSTKQEIEVQRTVEDVEDTRKRVMANLGGMMSVLQHMSAIQAQQAARKEVVVSKKQPVDVSASEVHEEEQ